MSSGNEEAVEKIDRLNNVIDLLMNDLSFSRTHTTRLSMMSSMQSFTDNFDEIEENSGSVLETELPQEYIDKFQECLTINDRLNMKIEDLLADRCRTDSNTSEIILNKAQIKALHTNLGEILESNSEEGYFSLNKHSLISGKLIQPSQPIFEKLSELEIENINLRTQLLSISLEKPKQKSEDRPSGINNGVLQYEINQIEISKREQQLYEAQEELGFKTAQAELLINEYKSKLEEIEELKNKSISQPFIRHKKSPSQDITRTRTPVSAMSQQNSFVNSLINNRNEIEAKLVLIENLLKKRMKKHVSSKNPVNFNSSPTIVSAFKERENNFKQKLKLLGNFSSKERYIIEYHKEQSTYLNQRIEELRQYELYLEDTWISSNGNPTGIEAVKKGSNRNFQKAQELKNEFKNLSEKQLRLEKLKETIKNESVKLQEHRKRILIERQKLAKQQSTIENFLKRIRDYTRNLN